jgi:hypothetical protein
MSATTVSLRGQAPGSVVYDLLARRPQRDVREEAADNQQVVLHWPVSLGPCDGCLFLAVPRAIGSLQVSLPRSAEPGDAVSCAITVCDDQGQPVPAILPLHVELCDPDGRPAEFSGYYATVDGRLDLTFDIARNDLPGAWYLRVQDLAAGCQYDGELVVE